jgi:hypothetical protein
MLNTSGLLNLSARGVGGREPARHRHLLARCRSRRIRPLRADLRLVVIIDGFGAQWMRFAYFGVYHHERLGE